MPLSIVETFCTYDTNLIFCGVSKAHYSVLPVCFYPKPVILNTSIVPKNHHIATSRKILREFDPGRDAEISGSEVQIVRFQDAYCIVNAIKTKCLSVLTCGEGYAVLQRAVIAVNTIVGVSFGLPPTDETRLCIGVTGEGQ